MLHKTFYTTCYTTNVTQKMLYNLLYNKCYTTCYTTNVTQPVILTILGHDGPKQNTYLKFEIWLIILINGENKPDPFLWIFCHQFFLFK